MIAKIVRNCNCVPFTFRKIAKGFEHPYCNAIRYYECQLDKLTEDEDCRKSCDNPCEYVYYQWHSSRKMNPDSQRSFKLVLTPVLSPFVAFTVTTKESPEQFLSQMAAVFNLYLGFSGLSVIAVVVICVDALFKWYHSRKQLLIKVSPATENLEVDDLQQTTKLGRSDIIALEATGRAASKNTREQEISNLSNKLEDSMIFHVQLKNQEEQWKCQQELNAEIKLDIQYIKSAIKELQKLNQTAGFKDGNGLPESQLKS